MVTIVKKEPDASVVKQAICRRCGCTLEYVPIDVKSHVSHDHDGGKETMYYIVCPNCENKIYVKNPRY